MHDDGGNTISLNPRQHALELVAPFLVTERACRFLKLPDQLKSILRGVLPNLAELLRHGKATLLLLAGGDARPSECSNRRRLAGRKFDLQGTLQGV